MGAKVGANKRVIDLKILSQGLVKCFLGIPIACNGIPLSPIRPDPIVLELSSSHRMLGALGAVYARAQLLLRVYLFITGSNTKRRTVDTGYTHHQPPHVRAMTAPTPSSHQNRVRLRTSAPAGRHSGVLSGDGSIGTITTGTEGVNAGVGLVTGGRPSGWVRRAKRCINPPSC